jgi:branched-chain amino acid transport system substrate-binding protein
MIVIKERDMLKNTVSLHTISFFTAMFAVQGTFAADPAPFRIGWNAELSGPWVFSGTSCLKGAQLAEKEINDAAGRKKLELVIQDNQTNPSQAVAVARSLDTVEKVDLLSGPTQADVAQAVYGYAEEVKVPYLVPVAAFPQLTNPGTKYTYRNEPDAVGWGYAFIKIIQEIKPNATLGIMVNDFAINRATVAGFKYQAEKEGLKIVGDVLFPQTANDATVQVAQMKSRNPDFILVGGGATAFDSTLTLQLIDVGFRPDQIIHPFASTKQLLNYTPRSVGSYYGTFFDQSLPNLTEKGKAFVENFRAAYGWVPGYVENYCYATLYFVEELVDAGAHDRATIHEALRTANTKEITTNVPINFDKNGARISYLYLMQIKSMTKDDFTAQKAGYVEWSPEVLPVYDLVR